MEPAASATSKTVDALERVFEVTSVLPLAGFALLHVGTYAPALFGATEIGGRHAPSGWALAGEALGIWLPLGFHTIYALPLWLARRRAAPAGGPAAWLALHRVTGLLLACFLVDHFVRFRLPILEGDRYPAESVQALARELSSTTSGVPLVAAFQALGTLSLAFHLGYGLWRVAERHAAAHAQRPLRVACVAVGALFGLLGTLTVVRLATG